MDLNDNAMKPGDAQEVARERAKNFAPAALALVAILGVGWIYAQAQGLMWGFDDYNNLKELANVSSYHGLVNFVFEGIAGPLGRPLSLLTFVANYSDWPDHPWGFVRVSILLHLVNAALLFMLVRRLMLQAGKENLAACTMAVAVAALWMAMPINASSILLPIQRMTLVSAFFVLLTLWGYAALRQRCQGTPSWRLMLLLSVWMAAGTGVAVLGKENGAVAITLAALLELFFFRKNWNADDNDAWRHRAWHIWVALALLAVPAALAAHVGRGWTGIINSFEFFRGYSFAEHLATQAVISWEYVRQIALPRAALLGPYHDDHAVYSWAQPQPWLAVLAWVALVVLCMWLRRQTDLIAKRVGTGLLFAIGWYWACHQTESTVIPLELYFAHRNYLAAIGASLLLMMLLDIGLQVKKTGLAVLAGCAFGAIQIFGLVSICSLWGQPRLANKMWYQYHPASTRAVQAVANDLIHEKSESDAIRITDQFIDTYSAADVAVQMFQVACRLEQDEAAIQARFDRLWPLIEKFKKPAGLTTGLASMGRAVRNEKCAGIDLLAYKQLLQQVIRLPRIEQNPSVRHHFFYDLALTEKALGDFDGYIEDGKRAFFDFPAISLAEGLALDLAARGQLDEAIAWTDQVIAAAPGIMLREAWRQQMASLRAAMLDAREQLMRFEAESSNLSAQEEGQKP
jgi:tetratricopeptide (TPR) repeat protein